MLRKRIFLITRVVSILWYSLFYVNGLYAADGDNGDFNYSNNTTDYYLDLSIDELINVRVTVASPSKVENISETPAVVSRYDLDDMQRLGFTRLEDMLTLIPGVVVKQGVIGYPVVIIRGITQFTNQKVLFLLDGVPYWRSSDGNFPLRSVPIESISHIEVIRGPGAIHYGTNATSGVIKITTKKKAQNVVELSTGSNDLAHSSGYLSHSFTDTRHINIAFETRREQGYNGDLENTLVFDQFRFLAEDLLGEPTIPASGTIPVKDESESIYLHLQYDDFKMMAHAYENEYQQIDGILAPFTLGTTTDKGRLLHFGYEWRNDKYVTNIFTDYTNIYHEGFATHSLGQNILGFGGGSSGTTYFDLEEPLEKEFRWRKGLTLNYVVNEYATVLLGAEHEERSNANSVVTVRDMPTAASDFLAANGLPDLSVEPFSTEMGSDLREKSFYSQIDLTVDKWRFLVGARYTDNSKHGSVTTPRLSTVYKIDDEQSIKLLYAVGFNTPSLETLEVAEIGANVPNPNLDSEEITTTDLAYTYSVDNHLFVANLYYLSTDGLVQNVYADVSPEDIVIDLNLDIHRYGLELDYQYAIDNWKLFTNLSYHHQGNRNDHSEDIVYTSVADFTQKIDDFTAAVVPRLTTVLGGHYTYQNNHTIGGSWRYISDMKGADAVHLVNLHYQYRHGNIEVYTQVNNLLDEEIVHPDDSIPPILLPGGDGIGWILGAKYRF